MQIDVVLDHQAPDPAAPVPVRALLRVTGQSPPSSDAVPLNLAIVLDHSGSMAYGKLDAAVEAATLVCRRIGAANRLSLVVYDDRVTTLAHGVTGAEIADLPVILRHLQPGATTNLSGGWLEGRERVAEHLARDAVNRVLLLTDGLANVGITNVDELASLCANALADGISTTTIGFGTDYNEDLLRFMADSGGGNAYYIETNEQAPGIFEEELEGLQGLAAQNVRVTVELAEGTALAAVHHGYPSESLEQGVRLSLGDLYGDEPRQLLIELMPRTLEPGAELELAQVTVSGHVRTADGGLELREVVLPLRLTVGEAARVEPEIQKVKVLLAAAEARREASRRADRGDFDGAVHALRAQQQELLDHVDLGPQFVEEARDLEIVAEKMRRHGYDATDKKYLKQRAYDEYRSRQRVKERYSRRREE